MEAQKLVSPMQLAALYPDLLSKPTLQRWRTEGIGPPYVKVGPRRVGYRIEDVDRWLAERVVTSTAAARTSGLAA